MIWSIHLHTSASLLALYCPLHNYSLIIYTVYLLCIHIHTCIYFNLCYIYIYYIILDCINIIVSLFVWSLLLIVYAMCGIVFVHACVCAYMCIIGKAHLQPSHASCAHSSQSVHCDPLVYISVPSTILCGRWCVEYTT